MATLLCDDKTTEVCVVGGAEQQVITGCGGGFGKISLFEKESKIFKSKQKKVYKYSESKTL